MVRTRTVFDVMSGNVDRLIDGQIKGQWLYIHKNVSLKCELLEIIPFHCRIEEINSVYDYDLLVVYLRSLFMLSLYVYSWFFFFFLLSEYDHRLNIYKYVECLYIFSIYIFSPRTN